MVGYETRFIKQDLLTELANLWHLSRVPCNSRYDRLIWTSGQFSKAHPEYTSTQAYKELDTFTRF